MPYRGTTQILPDLLGGRLNLFFGNISNCLPLVREGKLRAFAITSRKRSPQIPELPTMEELGFKDFDATAWFGLMAPAGTPQPIVDKIHAETVKVLAMPDVRAKLEGLGLQLVGNTPAEFADVVARRCRCGARSSRTPASRCRNRPARAAGGTDESDPSMAVALARWLLIAAPAVAQANYPDKPVRFIVGFTPGSATDITARLFAAKFAEAWNVPVTVENVPGAGGSVGGDRVAKSAPDGTTFYWGANGALTINPTLLAEPDLRRAARPRAGRAAADRCRASSPSTTTCRPRASPS